MWKISDFWKIYDFIKNENKSDLSSSLQAISKSEESISNNFFERTLDQKSFKQNNSDYNKLRSFLVNWYASLKTLTSIQKDINDIYHMPDDHLDELFRSKGFNFSNKLSKYGDDINYNKVNFYYDLVNLYKHKGTPTTVLNVLRYYGFPDLEILEWMTYRRRSTNDVEFHSVSADHTGKWWTIGVDKLTYNEATGWDPHYLTSEKSIVYGQNNSNLHLPTKSPYYSLRHYININEYNILTSFLSRKIQDQYTDWFECNLNGIPYEIPKDLYVNACTIEASVLELYLACIIVYYKHYGTKSIITSPCNENIYEYNYGDHNKYFNCYDGTNTSYLSISNEFDDYIENIPYTRDEIKYNQEYYLDEFCRISNKNFLIDEKTAEDKLKLINPKFYQLLINIYDLESHDAILSSLLEDMMKWVNSYLSTASPHINFLMYGTSEMKRVLGSLLNFFTPYHARLLSYDIAFIIDNRNDESAIVDDYIINSVEEVIHDWDTCNGKPCCEDMCGTSEQQDFYSRITYDCGSFYDIGGACDGREGSFKNEIEDNIHEFINCLNGFTKLSEYNNPSHEKYGIDNYNDSETILIPPSFTPEISGNNVTTIEAQSGNFISFDEGGCFDSNYGCDLCQIQIIE